MSVSELITWGFQGLLAGTVLYAARSLKGMQDSIDTLNKQVAVILERNDWHTRWLEKHDEQIENIKANK